MSIRQVYSSDLNHLIITYGKNDELPEMYLKDVYVFDLFQLQWNKLKFYGNQPIQRGGHCSAICGSKLINFGGVTLNGYIKSNFEIIELDQSKSKKEYTNQNSIQPI